MVRLNEMNELYLGLAVNGTCMSLEEWLGINKGDEEKGHGGWL